MPTPCSAGGSPPPRTWRSRYGSCSPPSSAPNACGGSASGRIPRSMPTITAPSQVELTRVYHFSAGHRLRNAALGDDENVRLYGACARAHGHNYYLELTVAGVPDAMTGMVLDLAGLDELVHQRVLERVDHHTLEEVPELA